MSVLRQSEQWLAAREAKKRLKTERASEDLARALKSLMSPALQPSPLPTNFNITTFPDGFPPAVRPMGATFDLPFPPSVNTYWRNIGPGRTILSITARKYRKAVLASCGSFGPLLGRLRVTLEIFPPDKRKRDLDNLPKGIFDALQHAGVYRDDEQIDYFSVQRMTIEKGGRCVVKISEL